MRQLWEYLHSNEHSFAREVLHVADQSSSIRYFDPQSTTNELRQIGEGMIRDVVGTGAFGLVFKAVFDENVVIKASRFGEIASMRRELKALLRLRTGSGSCNHVPRLESFGKVEYTIRKIKSTVPALEISPVGEPALNLATHDYEQLWSNIRDALYFGHKRNVYHLDVNPAILYGMQRRTCIF